mgnify:FL=1
MEIITETTVETAAVMEPEQEIMEPVAMVIPVDILPVMEAIREVQLPEAPRQETADHSEPWL